MIETEAGWVHAGNRLYRGEARCRWPGNVKLVYEDKDEAEKYAEKLSNYLKRNPLTTKKKKR